MCVIGIVVFNNAMSYAGTSKQYKLSNNLVNLLNNKENDVEIDVLVEFNYSDENQAKLNELNDYKESEIQSQKNTNDSQRVLQQYRNKLSSIIQKNLEESLVDINVGYELLWLSRTTSFAKIRISTKDIETIVLSEKIKHIEVLDSNAKITNISTTGIFDWMFGSRIVLEGKYDYLPTTNIPEIKNLYNLDGTDINIAIFEAFGGVN